MSDAFLGEIRVFSFNYPPQGWALCNGQLLSINQNLALFSLLGTYYGGDGSTNFALPNLMGRAATHRGGGLAQGQSGGEIGHTLLLSEIPSHTHLVGASTTLPPEGNTDPTASVVATTNANVYAPFAAANAVAMNPSTIGQAGSSQPHENRQPYLTLFFCIAMVGTYPSKN